MEKKAIVGIDPGLNGAIAVLDMNGNLVEVTKMPQTPHDILDFIRKYEGSDCVCYLEKVGQGMPGQSSKATATFARHNGHLEMALMACGIKTEMVLPNRWEKSYSLGSSKGHSKTEWKNILKTKAQQLFPNVKVTLALADALLIAEYARKQELGER
ncbi:DUF460 domain-containing protein [Bacteroides pyogenes]|uniref:DUF460 domain-containing protein n=1 Tax=Bacteroides pyogenes TaxID=310300 RepID=UPI002FDAD14A